MWTTRFSKSQMAPRLRLHVDAAVAQRGISRLSIWNFNLNQQLEKGVKNVRIFRQDRLVFEGVLEKGMAETVCTRFQIGVGMFVCLISDDEMEIIRTRGL